MIPKKMKRLNENEFEDTPIIDIMFDVTLGVLIEIYLRTPPSPEFPSNTYNAIKPDVLNQLWLLRDSFDFRP